MQTYLVTLNSAAGPLAQEPVNLSEPVADTALADAVIKLIREWAVLNAGDTITIEAV